MNYFIGIDPDIRNLSAICLDEKGKLAWGLLLKPDPASSKHRDGLAGPLNSALEFNIEFFGSLASFGYDEPQEIIICAEVPMFRPGGKEKNPQAICDLAFASGLMSAKIQGLALNTHTRRPIKFKHLLPSPTAWKGGVPKHIHQQRICKEAGISFTVEESGFPVPLDWKMEGKLSVQGSTKTGLPAKISRGDWKDLLDSWGLALWAMKQSKSKKLP